MTYGSAKSSGSVSQSSGSSASSGSSGSSGVSVSSGSSASSGGSSSVSSSVSTSFSYNIFNVTWVDSTVGDPSILDFDIYNSGAVTMQLDSVTCPLAGFYIDVVTPVSIPAGSTLHVQAFTEAGIMFSGTTVTLNTSAGASTSSSVITLV